ncbi:MAG: phospho-sugar mutase [Pirellulales bacterium]
MPAELAPQRRERALALVEQAAAAGQLTAGAAGNIATWLREPRYGEYANQVAEHIEAADWRTLDDVFWTIIPFGTGGRRGKMYPIGSNAINDRTIGESAQGLANYVRDWAAASKDTGQLSCAIAYDTRHRSRHFAELCAEIMVAAGFRVWFLDGFRSTPECSLAVRQKQASCGIMITASHNPPSDNAVKAYWSTGGQLLPPHDRGVIDCVMQVAEIERVPFAEAVADGRVVCCQGEVDAAYQTALLAQSSPGPRDLKIIYSPMHGVGAVAIVPMLAAAGFKQVELFGPHATPDGDFPNVPKHVANPENVATFDTMIARARETGADIVLSTDPDADRLGCAAPQSPGSDEWVVFNGNQIAALLVEHVLSTRKAQLNPQHYVVKTIVTSELVRRIAEQYGVHTYGDLLVGFKWIAGQIDEAGPAGFLFGAEESHGYLAGTHVRDKDAAVAALLLAELAAVTKAAGQTLAQKLDSLFWQFGCHAEKTVSASMPGSAGMAQMQKLMASLRTDPPTSLAGMSVTRIRDYEQLQVVVPGRQPEPLDGPRGDLVFLDLESPGNCVAVRPSGTEPKVKFYLFTFEPPEQIANLEDTKAGLASRLATLEADLAALAGKEL